MWPPDLATIVVPGWLGREVETGVKPEQAEAMHKAAFDSVFAPARDTLERAGLAATEGRMVGRVPGDELAAHATKSRLDLLVMGSLGFGANRRTAMGSVATRVASRCRTALLLVREK